MSGSDRGGDNKTLSWIFPLIGVVLAILLSWGIGWLQAREEYKRENTPTAYAEAAEKDAERACVGTEPRAVFECVNEKAETAYQAAHDEQDLSAQQRAASSALASAVLGFFSLLLSGVGVWYVKGTLDATLRAVKDTSEATDEMRKANAISNRIAEAELRPYLFVEHLKFATYNEQNSEIEIDGEKKTVIDFIHGKIAVHFHNYGKIPARNIRVHKRSFLARFYRGDIEQIVVSNVTTPVCAPGFERRIFEPFYVSNKNVEEFKDGGLEFIIRLKFTYDDGVGNKFSEKADYRLSGDDLETFYLLLPPFRVFEARKRWSEYEPELYGDYEHHVEAAEG